MKKILVTGFEPFGGEKVNPALELIKLLPKKLGDNEIKTLEIPTVQMKSLKKIEEEIEKFNPDFILSIGQAGGRTDISIERVAINIDDYRIPDNEGNQPVDKKIFEDGMDAYFSNLPIKAILKEIKETGIPCSISNTAGTYVCNHVFYGVRYLIETKYKNKKSGFIHIPYLPEQVIDKKDVASMGIESLLKAIIVAIEAIFKYEEDINVSAGEIC